MRIGCENRSDQCGNIATCILFKEIDRVLTGRFSEHRKSAINFRKLRSELVSSSDQLRTYLSLFCKCFLALTGERRSTIDKIAIVSSLYLFFGDLYSRHAV